MTRHTIREELSGVIAFIGCIWCVYFIGYIPGLHLEEYGVTPRTLHGLVGIPAAPFIHANLGHLISNTVPLSVLLVLLAGSRANTWAIVASIVVLSGTLLWLFGRHATHIGASGLIYGLIAYLIVAGIREGRIIPMLISIFVGILYGGTLALGVLPKFGSNISWEGHLFGAAAGAAIAVFLTMGRDNTNTPTMPNVSI